MAKIPSKSPQQKPPRRRAVKRRRSFQAGAALRPKYSKASRTKLLRNSSPGDGESQWGRDAVLSG
jgi:hypothetical protein